MTTKCPHCHCDLDPVKGKPRSLVKAGHRETTDEADDDGEGAKVPSLTDPANHSHEYTALIKEMDAIKSAGDLAEWGYNGKQRNRLARLPEGEVLLAKKHFEERGRALLNAAEEEPAPSGKSKK